MTIRKSHLLKLIQLSFIEFQYTNVYHLVSNLQ